MRRKTNEEYVKECKQKGIDLPIGDYVNNQTRIKHMCKNCGNSYKQSPNSHLQGKGCPKCAGKQKKTTKDYIEECKSKGYDLPIESYVNSKTKISHRCIKCGNVYKQKPNDHLHGVGCPYCYGNKKKTTKYYLDECNNLGIDLPIESYVNNKIKIKHRCNKCGNVYEQKPNSHLQGNGCPKCARKRTVKSVRKEHNTYIQECLQKCLDLPIEEYKGARVAIKHMCKQGHIYKQIPYMRLHYLNGCPICNQSHGEKYIQNYLDKHKIKYTPQKKFKGLKDKALLSYDFYLPNQKVLIEYQGIQHFESVSFNGKDYTDLEKQQYHDKLKREYAKKHEYTLLEPTYKLDTQCKVSSYLDIHLKG